MITKERVIKRYENRKLYDTAQSNYVTLNDISELIRAGYDVKVIDNKTKTDITFATQVQLLFEVEKKGLPSTNNNEILRRVIRSSGGSFTSYIRLLENIIERSEAPRTFEENEEQPLPTPSVEPTIFN